MTYILSEKDNERVRLLRDNPQIVSENDIQLLIIISCNNDFEDIVLSICRYLSNMQLIRLIISNISNMNYFYELLDNRIISMNEFMELNESITKYYKRRFISTAIIFKHRNYLSIAKLVYYDYYVTVLKTMYGPKLKPKTIEFIKQLRKEEGIN